MATRDRSAHAPTVDASERIYAAVSPRSLGGTSLFATSTPVTQRSVRAFYSDPADIAATRNELTQLGFEVLNDNQVTISIAGPRRLFEEVFGTRLESRAVEIEGQTFQYVTAATAPAAAALAAPERLTPLIEGVALAVPPVFYQSPLPPLAAVDPTAYRYLFAPDEVAVVLRAARVHRMGVTGKNIKVGMPDTGFYRHPYYDWHGYRTQTALLGSGAINAAHDSYGHGTGEAANIFAVAPDAELIPVKMGNDPVADFNLAVAQAPRVITCSWGLTWPEDRSPNQITAYAQTLAAAISAAVSQGIVVCFSGGNGTWRGFPAGHPDIISVGGVHVNYPFTSSANLEASSYASSFNSYFYPGRHVPDLCGLTGKRVNHNSSGYAPSLMLPVEPGSTLDVIWPATSAANDGWGLFSGTSAASPQVAGVVALMLEKNPLLTPADVKARLKQSATDITTGVSAMGDAAGPGVDAATGSGLVDAKWSWLVAMGEILSQFFEAEPAKQAEMLAAGGLPRLTHEVMQDLMESLRTR